MTESLKPKRLTDSTAVLAETELRPEPERATGGIDKVATGRAGVRQPIM